MARQSGAYLSQVKYNEELLLTFSRIDEALHLFNDILQFIEKIFICF